MRRNLFLNFFCRRFRTPQDREDSKHQGFPRTLDNTKTVFSKDLKDPNEYPRSPVLECCVCFASEQEEVSGVGGAAASFCCSSRGSPLVRAWAFRRRAQGSAIGYPLPGESIVLPVSTIYCDDRSDDPLCYCCGVDESRVSSACDGLDYYLVHVCAV